MPGARTLRVLEALVLSCAVACVPEGQSVAWPMQDGLGFLVGVDISGSIQLPVRGPFDLAEGTNTLTKSDGIELYVVTTQLERVALVEPRWAPDPTTLTLAVASDNLSLCPQGYFAPDGETAEHPLGREDEFKLFRLGATGFVPSESSALTRALAWQMPREPRCPQGLVTKVAPFTETIEYAMPNAEGLDNENRGLVRVDSDRALALNERWIHLLERGRAEPVAQLWADTPDIPEPVPSGGRSFEAIARLPTEGDEDARIVVTGTLYEYDSMMMDVEERGWFIVEVSVWPNAIRYERLRLHEREEADDQEARTAARVLATSDDGEILAAADERVFWAHASTSTVWTFPKFDPRAATILESESQRHALGGEDGGMWFGDASQGRDSFPTLPSFAVPGDTPSVIRILEGPDTLYALTDRSLSQGRPQDDEWELLQRNLPPDAPACRTVTTRNRCGRHPFPEKSVDMHLSERGLLMTTTFCDAVFLRHPDGCIDTVPVGSAPDVRTSDDREAHPKYITRADDRWLITADEARLYEVSVEGEPLQ